MAGNMIVIGSKFKPFSYDDMIKPIQVADAEHKALEGEMTELSSRAGVFDKLANEQTDPEAYAMYKKYSEDLSMQAESLAKSGLNPDSRNAISKMRQRYSQEITPIENAYKRRDELTKEQRSALLKDPTLLISQEASTLSLDDLIKNPNLSYQSYSGNMLTQQAAQQAAALAKFQQEQPRKWNSILGGQYWEAQEKKGYTPQQILAAAADDPSAPKELRKIANDVYSASGIDSWGNDVIKQRAKEAIGRGLYSAMETTEYKNLSNKQWDLAAQERRAAKKSSKEKRPGTVDRTSYFFEKTRQRIPQVLNEDGKLKENPNTWGASSKYNMLDIIFKDGKFTEPKEDSNPYNAKPKQARSYYNEINEILRENGFSQAAINSMNKETIEQNLKDIMEGNANDAIGRDLYRYSLDDNASSHLVEKLKGRGLKLEEIKSMKDGVPKYGGKTDIDLEKNETVDIMYDPKLNSFIVQQQGKYYKLPKGMISNDSYRYATILSKQMSDYQNNLKVLEDKLEKTGTLSEREKEAYNILRENLVAADSELGAIGREYLDYVGTQNINK